MSYSRYHRKRKNRSVHGTDQSCDQCWKTGHSSDPGDIPYLADGHAFLSPLWRPGIRIEFPDVSRRTL